MPALLAQGMEESNVWWLEKITTKEVKWNGLSRGYAHRHYWPDLETQRAELAGEEVHTLWHIRQTQHGDGLYGRWGPEGQATDL